MAMSGGVDSSVAAALLKEQGHDVIGLHMKLYHGDPVDSRPKSCCSLDEAMEARAVCHRLGIPFYVLDFQQEFESEVIDYFVEEYSLGRTPNPCIMCNRKIKSRYLLEKADELECGMLATGHYAHLQQNPESGRVELWEAADKRKDQSYFLFGISQEELARMRFPLAEWTKPRVRDAATQLELESASKPDSQEICFVPKDYRNFLESRNAQLRRPGEFVDLQGQVLGAHQGLAFYTIGQRRGLGLSGGEPWYVVRLDRESNQVVLGAESDLYVPEVLVERVNWVSMAPTTEPLRARGRLRYTHGGAWGWLHSQENGDLLWVPDAPERAVTPGQAAVFYDEQGRVLCGGWIAGAASV